MITVLADTKEELRQKVLIELEKIKNILLSTSNKALELIKVRKD